MPVRNRHKVGDYLMHDDESGLVHYRSEMKKIWNGTWRHYKNFETRQPQEFVQARKDPKALRDIRPEPDAETPVTSELGFIGETTTPTPTSPASHLFPKGIGQMVIETSFVVR